MPKKLTREEFIRRAREVHGDFFDYSKVVYVNSKTKFCIICPIHGEFWQEANAHLRGHGCPECSGCKKKDTERFIQDARKVHGDWYDYSMSDYKDAKTPVYIICPKHGGFWQTPNSHLSGQGCKDCGYERNRENFKSNTKEFIAKSRFVHGDKYDYSPTEYTDVLTPVKIICPIHGEFEQAPRDHLQGCGCPECGRNAAAEKIKMSFDEFVQKASKVHNGRYIYIKEKYKIIGNKIYAICPIHGEFEQTHQNHLAGAGCPYCNESHGERDIAKWLDEHNVKYERQYKVIPEQVLFGRNLFKIDFYLPDYNTFIEFHGEQHYLYNDFFHRSKEEFADQQDRDRRLREYCKQNKIRLIEIPYTEIDNIDKILTKKILKSQKN